LPPSAPVTGPVLVRKFQVTVRGPSRAQNLGIGRQAGLGAMRSGPAFVSEPEGELGS